MDIYEAIYLFRSIQVLRLKYTGIFFWGRKDLRHQSDRRWMFALGIAETDHFAPRWGLVADQSNPSLQQLLS